MRPKLEEPNVMGGPSLEVMELGYHLLKSGERRPVAIDLGAGTGRNSLFLASLGFEVMAVEHNRQLASQCAALLLHSGYDAQVKQSDVRMLVPDQPVDLCLCLGILHFLELKSAEDIVRRMKIATRPNGFHVLTIADPRYNRGYQNTLADQDFLGSVSSELLTDWYKDWQLLMYERYLKIDDHLDGPLDEHVIEKLVFTPAPSVPGPPHICRVWKVRPEKSPELTKLQLHRLVHSRASWDQVASQLGPPDLEIASSSSRPQLSAAPRGVADFHLHVAFWGRLKLYFENDKLVGFSYYQTDDIHSFTDADMSSQLSINLCRMGKQI